MNAGRARSRSASGSASRATRCANICPLLDSGQPIVLRVQRARALDPYEEVIKRLFVDCRGHCPNLQRRLKEQLGLAVQLRTLQKFCQPWRKTVLTPQERVVRYEVNLPDR